MIFYYSRVLNINIFSLSLSHSSVLNKNNTIFPFLYVRSSTAHNKKKHKKCLIYEYNSRIHHRKLRHFTLICFFNFINIQLSVICKGENYYNKKVNKCLRETWIVWACACMCVFYYITSYHYVKDVIYEWHMAHKVSNIPSFQPSPTLTEAYNDNLISHTFCLWVLPFFGTKRKDERRHC